MATVDELVVRIEADMGDLKRKLNQAKRDVDRSVGSQRKSFMSLGTAIKGAFVIAIGTAVARFGNQMVQMASAVEEMQAKSEVVFGSFVNNVRVELEEFGNAVGRSRFELEGMASSVQDTFVPLGFARGEASKLSVQLTKLAVDTASFNNATDASVMQAFQSALVGNHEAVRRFGIVITETELKAELMRMGITKNINLVSAQEKVQARLNLILAGTTDAQGDAERTAGSFANRSRALSSNLSDLGTEIGQVLLPAMTAFLQQLNDAVHLVRRFLQEIGVLEFRDLQKGIDFVNDKLRTLNFLLEVQKSKLAGLKEGTSSFNMENENIRANIASLEKQIEVFTKRLEKLQKAQADANKETANDVEKKELVIKVTKQFIDTIGNLERQNKTLLMQIIGVNEANIKSIELFHKANAVTDEQKSKIKGLVETQIELKQALQEQNTAIENAKTFVEGLQTEEEKLAKTQNDLNLAFAMGKISSQEYKDAMDEINNKLQALNPMFQAFKGTVEQVGQSIADSLADALVKGKLSLDNFQNIFRNFVQQMISHALRLMVINKAINAALGLTGSNALPTANMPSFGSRAGGGSVQANTPMMVGERGPELFIPNTGGIVKNNMDTKGMMSSGKPIVINQNLNFSTGVSQTVRAEVLNLLPQIQSSTLEAMLDAKQRGGTFATIMS